MKLKNWIVLRRCQGFFSKDIPCKPSLCVAPSIRIWSDSRQFRYEATPRLLQAKIWATCRELVDCSHSFVGKICSFASIFKILSAFKIKLLVHQFRIKIPFTRCCFDFKTILHVWICQELNDGCRKYYTIQYLHHFSFVFLISVALCMCTGCPNKNATFLTKLETIVFCSYAKIFLDSERVWVNLDSDTLASLIRQIFFEICKFEYKGFFFQEMTLGHVLRYQFYHFRDILRLHNSEKFATYWFNT